MKIYTDRKGLNPLTGDMVKELILGESFLSAWWAVCVYLLEMEISPFHMRMMSHRVSSNNTITMTGRGLGKSHLLTKAYTITQLLRDQEIAIAVITKTQVLSVKFVREIKQEFEEKSKIFEIFGDLRDLEEWSKLQFNLKREKNRPENTLTACSIGSSGGIVGGHYDILLIDDIVDDSNSKNRKIRDDMEEKLDNSFFPAMNMFSDYQYIHIVGTHYGPDDIYIRLSKKGMFKTLKIPSMIENEDGSMRCVWENIPKKGLDRILITKKTNPLAYLQQYQQKVASGDGGLFKNEWFKFFDDIVLSDGEVYAIVKTEEGVEKRRLTLYAGVDLAISQKLTSDYFVFTVIGVDSDHNIYILDINRGRYRFHEQKEVIKSMANKWPSIQRIGIESVAYQEALIQDLQKETSLPLKKMKTRISKASRLGSFSALFETGQVYFYSKLRNIMEMMNEYLEFPDGEHDDIPDSATLAWETFKGTALIGGINISLSRELSDL